jgi:uncharacterized protein
VSAPGVPSAVLDTSVLLPLLLTPRGWSLRLLDALERGRFLHITSEAILAELADVLSRPKTQKKHPSTAEEIRGAVDAIRQTALVVPGDYAVFVVAKDPKDNPIMACALEGGADYVVSEDKYHLLPIKYWRGIQVVSVAHFLRAIGLGRR